MNQLELAGKNVKVVVNGDMRLTILRSDGRLIWESSKSQTPTVSVLGGCIPSPKTNVEVRAGGAEAHSMPLSSATHVSVSAFDDGKYRGHAVCLHGFEGVDVVLELQIAIDASTDELMIQIAQVNGSDTVVSIEHFYRFEKPVADGGYMVLPHGSGYLVWADCPDELPGQGHRGGFIGARWTLPMFGMVRDSDAMCFIVDTWWDCNVEAEHVPDSLSTLDFHWRGSLGKLDYPRRFFARFAEGMDYVAMAKLYREYARKQGLLRTLEEKAVQTPVIRRYIEDILVRWPAWNAEDGSAVLADIRRLRDMGFGINFFFPKWSSMGYSPKTNAPNTADAGWQAYLQTDPVPGGWKSPVDFAHKVHNLGGVIQGFINPRTQRAEGPEYDEARWPCDAKGKPIRDLSTHDALDRIKRVLDNIEAKGLKYDVLYYDGYSAYYPLPEDYSPLHPQSRRQTFEGQNACFAETGRRGIMPGGELARFWCIANCDYFFFTDWSSDRLSNTPVQGAPAPVGIPVPLFQLVFHDCYIAGFSGGGYALYSPGYDWWADRTPRLYELFFASAPAHNWLPDGHVPIHWDNPKTKLRWTWLKRWSDYYRSIAMSEMVSHKFLSADRAQQRIEFANGVVAEFNMATNELRVENTPNFSGEWEKPEEL